MPACSSACPARGRIRADQEAKGHPSSRSVAATPLRRLNWLPARSKPSAICGPLLKALIRESPHDLDQRNITADYNTTTEQNKRQKS
jgi:hypothetical protein